MPTVPTYDQLQVTPNTRPLTPVSSPNVHNFAADNAQRQGQAMQQLGGELSKQATEMQLDANHAIVTDAVNASVQHEQELELGDNGYTKLQGRDALDRPQGQALWDEYGAQLDKANGDIARKMLKNDAQRQAFDEIVAQRRTTFISRIMRHAATEQKKYNLSVQKGTIEVANNRLALSGGDPEVVADSVTAIKGAVMELGRLQGKAKDEIAADMVDALSPGHAAVISSAVDSGRTNFAQQYLDAHNAELTPAARIQMTKLVEAGKVLGRAQDHADQIMGSGVSDADKLAAARNISDPKLRDAVVARVKSRINETRALEAQLKADHYDRAAQLADQGHEIPASLRVGLSPSQLNALDKLHAKRVSGQPIQTDEVAYGEFSLMPIEQLAKMTPQQYHEKYRALFDDSHYEGGLNLIRAARATVAKEGQRDSHRAILSFDAAFKTVAAEAGIIKSGGVKELGDDDYKAWARMRQEAARRVNELESNTGKKATSDEMLKISRQVLADKVYLDQFGTDPQVPVSGVSADDLSDAYVKVGGEEVRLSNIPFKDRMLITEGFRLIQGREPTQQEIAAIWVQHKGQK